MSQPNEALVRQLMLSLWINWTITVAAICAVLLMPLAVSKMVMPILIAVLVYLLLRRSRHNSIDGSLPNCVLVIRVAMLSLFWSAMVMATINVLNTHTLLDGLIDWSKSNRDIPYITGMVLFPVIAIVCIYEHLRGFNSRFCRECQFRHGFNKGSNAVTALYSRESRYQVKLLLIMSVATVAVQYWYYFVYYMNVNLNAPDHFYFIALPIVLYSVSVYIMKVRYTNIASIIGPLTAGADDDRTASVRLMIISGDNILLTPNSAERLDTPVSFRIAATNLDEAIDEVRGKFAEISKINTFELKYLYSNSSHNLLSHVDHYAVVVDDKSQGNLNGRWVSTNEIDQLIESASVATDLVDEIYRIHTITMAWKTYDRTGHRLYPVKNYRPQFHLRDIMQWKVDYNDCTWFNIADNNEDRAFFNLRRLWKRLTGQTSQ